MSGLVKKISILKAMGGHFGSREIFKNYNALLPVVKKKSLWRNTTVEWKGLMFKGPTDEETRFKNAIFDMHE